jgi:hypothetical protein
MDCLTAQSLTNAWEKLDLWLLLWVVAQSIAATAGDASATAWMQLRVRQVEGQQTRTRPINRELTQDDEAPMKLLFVFAGLDGR